MSSITEHLAVIDFYRTVGLHDAARNEGWLLLNVHWRELVDAIPADKMGEARAVFIKRVREQHPSEATEKRIQDWINAIATRPKEVR